MYHIMVLLPCGWIRTTSNYHTSLKRQSHERVSKLRYAEVSLTIHMVCRGQCFAIPRIWTFPLVTSQIWWAGGAVTTNQFPVPLS